LGEKAELGFFKTELGLDHGDFYQGGQNRD
jgi:hypothetical protein